VRMIHFRATKNSLWLLVAALADDQAQLGADTHSSRVPFE
jgi:hypothetical protein